jgi:glutathione S-transferase
MLRYVRMVESELLPQGRYPSLEALSARCEALPEFQATFAPDTAYLRGD